MTNTDLEPLSEERLDSMIDQLVNSIDEIPEAECDLARQHAAQVTPFLIKLIDDATRDARQGLVIDDNAHCYATYLLAEFEAAEAWPVVRDMLSLPGELVFDLFGDAVTEHFSQIIASLIGSQFDCVDELLANDDVNLFVRWSAIDALACKLRDGLITPEAYRDRLARYFQKALERHDEIAGYILLRMRPVGVGAMLPEIEKAYTKGIIDPDIISLEELSESPADEKPLGELFHQLCTREQLLSEFACFAFYADEEPAFDAAGSLPPLPLDWIDETEEVGDNETTIRNLDLKVGRNEKCPCGSGKKYKKCCGSRG
ncbi:MAG: DUF1186 domain-containing protein [Planctomycetota bacterium]